ncbi:M23 family metallopeptidase [Bdellovibrionota bacterium FG-2]
MKIFSLTLCCLVMLGASACGTAGNEPMSTLGDPNKTFVGEIALPVAVTSFNTLTPFSASTDGFELNNTLAVAVSQNVAAPLAGYVSGIDSTQIVIVHNAHVATRLSRLASVSVRIGDYVSAGQVVGTSAATGGIVVRLAVIVDGVAVCPYSYLSASARSDINSRILAGQILCSQ